MIAQALKSRRPAADQIGVGANGTKGSAATAVAARAFGGRPLRRARVLRALLAALACCGLVAAAASPAGAWVVHGSQRHAYGMVLRAGVSPGKVKGSVAAANHYSSTSATPTNLAYGQGAVLHSSTPYLIFWDPGNQISTTTRSLVERYFTDSARDSGLPSNVFAVGRQFYDTAGAADYRQAFGGALVDTAPYPSNGCTDPAGTHATCLSDSQLVNQVFAAVTAQHWPSGLNPIYFIVTPPSVVTCESSGTPCSDDVFCAYHSGFSAPLSGSEYLYADIPMTLMDSASDEKSCQADGNGAVQEPNGDVGDVVLKYLSHEYNETITDPNGDGWVNPTSGAEDGDQCNSIADSSNAFLPTLSGNAALGTLANQLVNGHQYYVQGEWSNGDSGCRMQPAAGTVTPSFTPVSAAAGSPASFSPSATTSSNPIAATAWDFGDGGQAFTIGSSLAAAQHTYAVAGSYPVRLTVYDNRGNANSATQTVQVAAAPTTAAPSPPPPTTSSAPASTTPIPSAASNPTPVVATVPRKLVVTAAKPRLVCKRVKTRHGTKRVCRPARKKRAKKKRHR